MTFVRRHRLALIAHATLFAASLAVAGPPVAAQANLIVNPSFETGPAPGMAIELPVGSTALEGWTVTRNPVDYCEQRWDAPQGVRSVALNGLQAGGIAQSFATVPGGAYTVTFFMGGDAFSNPVMKHMRVTAAGQFQDYEFDATHAWPWGMGWLEKSFTFQATAMVTTLEFHSLDADSTGPTLDNVSVTGPSAGVPSAISRFALAPPRPNPAPRDMEVRFEVPATAAVRVTVLDLQGREIAVLADGVHAPGPYTRRWSGAGARAGMYWIRLESPGVALTRKAVLTR